MDCDQNLGKNSEEFLQQADWDSQELWTTNSWKIACLTCQKTSCWENKKSQHSKHSHSTHKKCWMSQRLWKHEEFTAEEEKDLFKMSFLTARKQCASTQSESESKTSTKKSTERFDKEFLFDKLTESSNTAMMNFFQ